MGLDGTATVATPAGTLANLADAMALDSNSVARRMVIEASMWMTYWSKKMLYTEVLLQVLLTNMNQCHVMMKS